MICNKDTGNACIAGIVRKVETGDDRVGRLYLEAQENSERQNLMVSFWDNSGDFRDGRPGRNYLRNLVNCKAHENSNVCLYGRFDIPSGVGKGYYLKYPGSEIPLKKEDDGTPPITAIYGYARVKYAMDEYDNGTKKVTFAVPLNDGKAQPGAKAKWVKVHLWDNPNFDTPVYQASAANAQIKEGSLVLFRTSGIKTKEKEDGSVSYEATASGFQILEEAKKEAASPQKPAEIDIEQKREEFAASVRRDFRAFIKADDESWMLH